MSRIVNNKVAYGKTQGLIDVFNPPIVALRAPTGNDKGSIGQLWTNTLTNGVWMLTSFAGGIAIWTELDNSGGGGGLMTWSVEAGAAVAMANNHGYVNANAGLTTFTLPLVSPVGSQITILGTGAGGWSIAQNAAQQIRFSKNNTTLGVGGSMGSSHSYSNVTIICRVANTLWDVVYANDNLNMI